MSRTFSTLRPSFTGVLFSCASFVLACSSTPPTEQGGNPTIGAGGVSGRPVPAATSGTGPQNAAGATNVNAGRGVTGTAPTAGAGSGAAVGGTSAGQAASAAGGGGTLAAGGGAAGSGTAGSAPVAGATGVAGNAGISGAAGPDTAPGADDVWISPSGADSAPGTQAMPLQTLAAAVQRAKPGLTIWVTAGTYPISQTVPLKASGEANQPLRIFAAPGERPVFDFSAQPRGSSSARGIQISGNYWHLRGIDVIKAGDNCIHISGAHNTIENVVTHDCSDTGIQITADGSDAADQTRAAHNTVLNCDSYDNYDAANAGENADGFAAKLYIGPGNVFRGCRAWHNADDGWDLFASDDVVVIEDSWAIANGKIGATQNNTNGDGNGFKLGGAARAGDANMGGAVHEVKNCVSIENRACGFVRNNNTKEPALSMCGGRGDGKGIFCSLTSSGSLSTTMSAADAMTAKRDASGNLPPVH